MVPVTFQDLYKGCWRTYLNCDLRLYSQIKKNVYANFPNNFVSILCFVFFISLKTATSMTTELLIKKY